MPSNTRDQFVAPGETPESEGAPGTGSAAVGGGGGTARNVQTPPASLNRNRAFNFLWAGETASQFGFQVAMLAASTTAIVVLGATEGQVGLLNGLQTLAFLLIGLPAGAWVDRWRKRRTMIVADLVRMVALASIPIAWALDALTIYHMMVVVTIFGFGTVFFDVAYQSFVPSIVKNGQIGQANGRLEASFQVARVGGPGLAGWLIGIFSAPVTFGLTVGTLGFSAAAIASIPGKEPKPAPPKDSVLWHQIRDGLSYVKNEPLLGPLFLCIAGNALFGQGVFTLLPVLALREMGLDAQTLGALLSFGAVGGLIGAGINRWVVLRLGDGHTIAIFSTLGSLVGFGLPFAAMAGANGWVVLVSVGFFQSLFQTVYNIVQLSLRQRICPKPLLGRLNATFRFAVWGVMPIGSVASGFLAGVIGVVPAMVVFLAGTLCASIAMAFTPVAKRNWV